MAITITSRPQTFCPSDNPLVFTFTSTQSGQVNFSFKVETLLGGNVISEDRVFVEVGGNKAHIDVSGFVRSHLNSPTIKSTYVASADISDTLQVRVTESYGITPTDHAVATSTAVNVFKARVPLELWEVVDFNADYRQQKWMTAVPNNENRIIRGQDVAATMITGGATVLYLRYYDSSGSILYTHAEAVNYSILQVNAGSEYIEPLYFGAGTFADVAYFTLQVDTSEILTFRYVDTYCHDIYALVWINAFGSFDQFPVEHNLTKSGAITRNSFRKQYGAWSGTTYVHDIQSSGDLQYFTRTDDTGTIVTSYMQEEVQNWLVNNLTPSPRVFLYGTSGILYPVNITSSGFSEKKGRFEDLISEEFQYKKSVVNESMLL